MKPQPVRRNRYVIGPPSSESIPDNDFPQEEKAAQRKLEQKKEIERKRAAKVEEERRLEQERKVAEQQKAQEAKIAAQKQAEQRRLEQQRREAAAQKSKADAELVSPPCIYSCGLADCSRPLRSNARRLKRLLLTLEGMCKAR